MFFPQAQTFLQIGEGLQLNLEFVSRRPSGTTPYLQPLCQFDTYEVPRHTECVMSFVRIHGGFSAWALPLTQTTDGDIGNTIWSRIMRSPKVLLAIRRSQSRNIHTVHLREQCCEVVTADNGIECLEVLSWFVPDVVVIEPELTWGGGDGVVAVLRETPSLRDIPVLVLTTDFNRSSIYSISQFSVGDFWVQPVLPERLTACVRRLALGDKQKAPNAITPLRTDISNLAGGEIH